MKKMVIAFLSLSILIYGVGLPGIAAAAEKGFPNKEITVIVSLAAGGGRDITARGVCKVMSKYLGVEMVVSNMPGAGGSRGMKAIYNAVPDGYTIGLYATSEVISQILEKQDYDINNFSYLGRAANSITVYYVKSNSPIKSFKEFKNFGTQVRMPTQSFEGVAAISAMILASRENIPLKVIAGFKNVTEAMYSMLRGEGEFIGTQPASALSLVKAGEMRPILVLLRNRIPDYPGVETVAELGQEEIADIGGLDTGFCGPPKIPKDRLKILEDALMKTLKDPEFLKWAKAADVNPAPLSSEETTKRITTIYKNIEPYKGVIEKYIKK